MLRSLFIGLIVGSISISVGARAQDVNEPNHQSEAVLTKQMNRLCKETKRTHDVMAGQVLNSDMEHQAAWAAHEADLAQKLELCRKWGFVLK